MLDPSALDRQQSSVDDAPGLSGLSRGIASVLPFLVVAWAEGRLSADEIAAVREAVAAQDDLTPEDRETLDAWLDPARPPAAAVVQRWRATLRRAMTHLSDDDRASLAGLGTGLARLAEASSGDGGPASAPSRVALAEMESLLGIVGREAAAGLNGPAPAPDLADSPPAFDIDAMRRLLDGPHGVLRDRVRALLADPFFAYPEPGVSKEDYRDLVLRWTQRLADEGLGALAFPEWAGGRGSIGEFIAAFETIAYHDLSLVVKFGVQFGLWGGSVAQLGGDAQRRAWLPRIGSLEAPGCFAMSERDHGSNVRDLNTTATFDPEADEWVVHTPAERDHKEWIGNAAAHGHTATVFAQLVVGGEGYGVHAFLVPIRTPDGQPARGVRIEDSGHKMGLNGVDNGRLWFAGVRVPRTNLLDRFAQVGPDGTYTSAIPSEGKRFFVMLGTLVGGRIAVGSAAASAAKAGLAIAVRYGARRRQFGPAGGPEVPLLDYLSHQRRLLPLVAESTALTFALHDLADQFAVLPPDADTREVEATAAALKAAASWHATAALQEAREATGGEGYRWTSRIAHRKADSDIFTTFEGDNTVLMLQVAKGLLAGYQAEFSDLSLSAVVRFLRDRVGARVGEVNPLARTNASPEHLRSAGWHRQLFVRRERQLLVSAARRLKHRIDAGADSFDAFVEVQDHLLTLARAHAERLVLEAALRAVDRAPEGQLQTVLGLQATLYALTRIEADRGWFLEEGLFDGSVARGVRREVNALLERLRPLAVELVDSFGIPDALLGSDIAHSGAHAPRARPLPPPDPAERAEGETVATGSGVTATA